MAQETETKTLKELREDKGDCVDKLRNYMREHAAQNTEVTQTQVREQTEALRNVDMLIKAEEAIEEANQKPRKNAEFFDPELDGQKPSANQFEIVRKNKKHAIELNRFGLFDKDGRITNRGIGKNGVSVGEYLASTEYRQFFMDTIARGDDSSSASNRLTEIMNSSDACPDGNVATASDFATGGWLTTPITFIDSVLTGCDSLNFLRQLATKVQVMDAKSVGIRLRTKRADTYVRGCVCTAVPGGDPPEGDVKVLTPAPYTARVDICGDLIRRSVVNAESFFANELAESVARGQENQFWYGPGGKDWVGLLTPNAFPSTQESPIPEACDQSHFLDILCKLDLCYLRSGSMAWAMNKDVYCCLMKLESTFGHLLWANDANRGLTNGPPTMLLGYPVLPTEFIANGAGVGDYPVILGDFSKYYIGEAMMMTVEKDRNVCTDTTRWFARGYDDGMPIIEEAFVRGVRT